MGSPKLNHVYSYKNHPQMFTCTSLTTSWSSASAIARILGLPMKLEKSKQCKSIIYYSYIQLWTVLKNKCYLVPTVV